MTRATACKVCGAAPERGAYCMPCWRERDARRKRGDLADYRPREVFVAGMLCSGCLVPITDETRFNRYTLCKKCGRKKSADKMREWRGSQQRKSPQRRPLPALKYGAKRQKMAPPAPKMEVKPQKVVVPAGMKITRVELKISRFEHGGETLWG